MTNLLDLAVITIFARETLEGGIIIGEYRTVIQRCNWQPERQQEALRAVTVAAIGAAALALVICAAIAIPLAVLSRDFNDKTAIVIEGASKIVAAICILQLSLKMPKFFGLYYSKAQVKKMESGEPYDEEELERTNGMTLRSIRFNVAWNIWREVAECGVFLIPFFLSGDGIVAIPLSALVGIVVGGLVCLGILFANHRFKNTGGLTVFTVGILLILSTGLFAGGCHKFEMVYGSTPIVWELEGDFWSVDRLPMTIFKPFGYSDTRTVLEMVTFWVWLLFGLFVHYLKWRRCRKVPKEDEVATKATKESSDTTPTSSLPIEVRPGSSSSFEDEAVENIDIEEMKEGEEQISV
jgi:high-affinity iron transporter